MSQKPRHPEKVNKPINPIKKKPEWIRSKIVDSQIFFQTKKVVNQNNLVTVCQEANCPNITECWSKKHETFMMTYGDGLSNINIKKLLKFHKKNKKLVTMSVVRPPARFGFVKLNGKKVSYFREKSKLDEGWINGGFFVMEPKFLDLIKDDKTFLEKEPLEKVAKKGQLCAFKHSGFWQCMDTKRDKDKLEEILKNFEK